MEQVLFACRWLQILSVLKTLSFGTRRSMLLSITSILTGESIPMPGSLQTTVRAASCALLAAYSGARNLARVSILSLTCAHKGVRLVYRHADIDCQVAS